jgi:hypothetical protein
MVAKQELISTYIIVEGAELNWRLTGEAIGNLFQSPRKTFGIEFDSKKNIVTNNRKNMKEFSTVTKMMTKSDLRNGIEFVFPKDLTRSGFAQQMIKGHLNGNVFG